MNKVLLLVIGVVIVLVVALSAITVVGFGVLTYGDICSSRQAAALQGSFERKIQRLDDSGKLYVVSYGEDDLISGIFTFRNVNDMDSWICEYRKSEVFIGERTE